MARFESTVQFAVNAQTNNVVALDVFRKKMDEVNQSAKKTATEGLGSFDSGLSLIASRLSGPFAAAISGASLISFGRRTLEMAGRLDDASKSTRVAAETLDKYQQAAELAGVSFEQVTGGLAKFNKSIADAASGNEAAADAFGQLGISVKNQDGTLRSTEEVFADFAKRVREAPNDAAIFEQGTILLGRSFANLIPFFQEGTSWVDQFKSRFSKGSIQELAEFDDQILRIQKGFGNMGITIVENVVPALQLVFNGFAEAREAVQNFLNTNNTLESVLDSIAAGYIRVASAARLLYDVVNPFSGSANPLDDFARIKKQQDEAIKKLSETRLGGYAVDKVDLFIGGTPNSQSSNKPSGTKGPSVADIYKRDQEAAKETAATQRSYAAERQRAIAEEARALKQLAQERAREDERQKSILSDFARQNQSRLDDLQLELQLMGKSRKEQEEILFLREIDNEARRLGLDLTDENIAKLEKEAEAAQKKVKVVLDEIEKNRGSFSAGVGEGIAKYLDDVNNLSLQASNLVMNTFQGAEDALIPSLPTNFNTSAGAMTNHVWGTCP